MPPPPQSLPPASPPPPSVGGLLSKVVKFVSNPTKDWKDLDQPEVNAEEEVNAQQVRERIERKRRNDFIRRAEFAHLRKIINGRKKQRQAHMTPSVLAMLTSNRPGSQLGDYKPALAPQATRAGTLQKINEIEEQLSRQWWQGGQQGRSSKQAGMQSQMAPAAPPAAVEDDAVSGFFLTGSSLFFADEIAAQVRAARRAMEQGEQALQASLADWVAKLRDMDAVLAFYGFEEVFVHQADLEEASILFASNRVAEAEKVLIDVIRKHAGAPLEQQVDIWMTLFDLYRAIGAQDRFHAVAIDFAKRFDRSAPVWFSMPEQLGSESQASGDNRRPFSWMSSPDVSVQTVATASALRQRARAPYTLNWTRLKSIQPEALEALIQFVQDLSAQEGVVQFSGAENLMRIIEAHTSEGGSSVDRNWWLLRLALLRLMGDAETFELAALDYTITYEESPPAWVPPTARYGAGDSPEDAPEEAGEGEADKPVMQKGTLQGRIEDDATSQLEQAVADLPERAPVDIDCSKLVAMDFTAAGSVLNWAAQQQSEGRAVVFSNLHRLVAIFFAVLGIQEHARVVPRKN
ncbi:MAG: STAS domain-containing protein [Comamonadaceae bacterium]|nr:STAS domain-containing protein [Comamonadaceae bacterium]